MPAPSWNRATASNFSPIHSTITRGGYWARCRNPSQAIMASRAAIAALVAALLVSACSPAIDLAPSTGNSASIGTASDINPQDPATLQDGGDLRLALTDFPPNFNILNIDGNSAEVAAMMKATLP